MMHPVSMQACPSYDKVALRESLRSLMAPLGGMEAYVRPGQRVLLKPNLLCSRPIEQRVVTDPAVALAVGEMILDAGGSLTIADSPALDPWRKVIKATGMDRVAADLGAELVELSGPRPVIPGDRALFRNLEIAGQVLDAEVVINLPKLKTHCQMLLTLGVKNLFGVIVAQRKAEWHGMAGTSREVFASLLLDIHDAVAPALTILDGVWGMEGRGPSNGSPRHFGLLAASADALALDFTLTEWLGVHLSRLPLFRAARERGLPQAASVSLPPYTPPPPVNDLLLPELDSLEMLPDFLAGIARRRLVSKPVQDKKNCRFCGKCVEICPAKCLELGRRGLKFDYDTCIRCYCCQEVCPHNAIEFRMGLVARSLRALNR